MLRRFKRDFDLTPGERGIALAYLGIGVFGAILAFTVVNQLGGGADVIRPMTAYDLWSICAGVIGALAGLYLGTRWLGQPGWQGWLRALIAVPVVSLFAALIAGTLALPGHGTMFGPLGLVTTLIAYPTLALLWLAMITAAHVSFVQWRKERDTIFHVKDSEWA